MTVLAEAKRQKLKNRGKQRSKRAVSSTSTKKRHSDRAEQRGGAEDTDGDATAEQRNADDAHEVDAERVWARMSRSSACEMSSPKASMSS